MQDSWDYLSEEPFSCNCFTFLLYRNTEGTQIHQPSSSSGRQNTWAWLLSAVHCCPAPQRYGQHSHQLLLGKLCSKLALPLCICRDQQMKTCFPEWYCNLSIGLQNGRGDNEFCNFASEKVLEDEIEAMISDCSGTKAMIICVISVVHSCLSLLLNLTVRAAPSFASLCIHISHFSMLKCCCL